VLENPIWHALAGPHEAFAEAHGRARRYQRDVSVFSAVDVLDAAAWADLAACADDNSSILLIRSELPDEVDGWKQTWNFSLFQMVVDELRAPRADTTATVRELGADDIEAMLALTAIAGPGPFVRGTPQFGGYVGVFEDGHLLAMAGQRMRLPGMTEISAVCTHPDARGRGLGELVSHRVASAIIASGDQPFLHVAIDNDNAIRLYDRLGFTKANQVAIAGYEHCAKGSGT
jgi:ribosomal protein S18 acetylase RimI-like enzyme